MIKTILIVALILGIGLPSSQSASACAERDIQHWNKLVFTVGENLIAPSSPDIFANEAAEVIVQVDPDIASTIKVLVFEKLLSIGYTDEQGDDVNLDNISSVSEIEYSTICADFLSQVVGGLLIKPDVGALLLAYAIMNAFWMAPMFAGLGIGLYLIKRKIE